MPVHRVIQGKNASFHGTFEANRGTARRENLLQGVILRTSGTRTGQGSYGSADSVRFTLVLSYSVCKEPGNHAATTAKVVRMRLRSGLTRGDDDTKHWIVLIISALPSRKMYRLCDFLGQGRLLPLMFTMGGISKSSSMCVAIVAKIERTRHTFGDANTTVRSQNTPSLFLGLRLLYADYRHYTSHDP